MQRIVDELLDLSRIESGHWKPRPEVVGIRELADEVFSRLSAAAKSKGISFDTRIGAESTAVRADRTALEQILLNLVENAVRYTGEGGLITIETTPRDDGVEVIVRDTGAGIPPEHLARIFERFYRADSGRSRESGGTGLGLAIVKHLVEAHGGWVGAESTVGSGTEIRAFFPSPAINA
jgi:signal transduction histidine kinase